MEAEAREHMGRQVGTTSRAVSRWLAAWSVGWLAVTILPARAEVWPGSSWETVPAGNRKHGSGQDGCGGQVRRDRGGSGIITRWARRVAFWGDQGKKYDLKSTCAWPRSPAA